MARALGCDVGEIPADWYRTAEILKSKPGQVGAAGPRWATDVTAAMMRSRLTAQTARKGLERMGGSY